MQALKTEILENFSVRLKGLMEKKGLTLQDVSDALVSNGHKAGRSTIGAWCRAQNFPSMEIIPDLAKHLDTETDFLIYGKSAQKSSFDIIHDRLQEPPQVGYKAEENVAKSRMSKKRESDPQGRLRYLEEQTPSLSTPKQHHPTEDDCLNHLQTYLSHAREVPGGIGHCYTQLKLHLSIGTIKRLKEEEQT